MFIDGLMDYLWIIVMNLSAVWSLILMAPIHWWATEETNIYILNGLSVSTFSADF